jgi:hypothetical protein
VTRHGKRCPRDDLTRNDFIAGLARHGPERRVGDVMRREFVTANPRDMLQTAAAC